MTLNFARALLTLLTAGAAAGSVTVLGVSMVELGGLPGSTGGRANAVNVAGDLVGEDHHPVDPMWPPVHRPFLRRADGSTTPLPSLAWHESLSPAMQLTRAWDINDRGLVVGEGTSFHTALSTPQQELRAVVWEGNRAIALPAAPEFEAWRGNFAFAKAINNNGDIVGATAYPGTGGSWKDVHPVIWRFRDESRALVVDLAPTAKGGEATDLNEKTEVVGYTHDGVTSRAFRWNPHSGLLHFGPPNSRATGINESGQIVGYYIDTGNRSRAFLRQPTGVANDPGVTIDLGDPPGSISGTVGATAITDEGHVLANALFLEDGQTRPRPVLWIDGRWHRLPVHVAGEALGQAMNSAGRIAGGAQGRAALFDVSLGVPEISDQTIRFDPIADQVVGGEAIPLSAVASSGLLVSYAATGSCEISEGHVVLTGAGVCTITASQEGSEAYRPAAPVTQSFAIAKGEQTITFPAIPDKRFGEPPFSPGALISSNIGVVYTASGRCTAHVATVSIDGAGSCTVTASHPGNESYLPAEPVSRTFAIAKATPTIEWTAPGSVPQGTILGPAHLTAWARSAAPGGGILSGTQVYTPAAGTVLREVGRTLLGVEFTPADAENYEPARAEVTVEVTNVAPAVSGILGSWTIIQGETFRTRGSFADPGTDAPWTASANYGFGDEPVPLSGNTFELIQTYAAAGRYAVLVTVRDRHGTSGSAGAAVVVRSPADATLAASQEVTTLANSGQISSSDAQALTASYDAAYRNLSDSGSPAPARTTGEGGGGAAQPRRGSAAPGADGRRGAARNQLNAAINKVEAMLRDRSIAAADGERLIALTRRIIAQI